MTGEFSKMNFWKIKCIVDTCIYLKFNSYESGLIQSHCVWLVCLWYGYSCTTGIYTMLSFCTPIWVCKCLGHGVCIKITFNTQFGL